MCTLQAWQLPQTQFIPFTVFMHGSTAADGPGVDVGAWRSVAGDAGAAAAAAAAYIHAHVISRLLMEKHNYCYS